MDWSEQRLETRAIHAGDPRPRIEGALTVPIFQSTVFEHPDDGGSYHDVRYPRLNNLPNHVALGEKLASIERAEAAQVTGSGMAAISTTLLWAAKNGGHVLVQDQLYGGTHNLFTRYIGSFGIEYDFIDADRPESWRGLLRPETRAIYTETLTNPLLRVIDHKAVVKFARENKLLSIIDNTFATAVNFRPIEIGYDLSLHSATKYLNGHSDLVAGAVIGSRGHIEEIRHLLNELGGMLDPHSCFLLNRGMKTLVLRVRQQNSNALILARFLADHEAVSRVNYPGLEQHPHHARARELFEGCGGVLSFDVKEGLGAAKRFVDRVQIPTVGPSLGGVETLVTRPVTTSHASLTQQERDRLGIGDSLIRVAVGVEQIEDLIADFGQALEA